MAGRRRWQRGESGLIKVLAAACGTARAQGRHGCAAGGEPTWKSSDPLYTMPVEGARGRSSPVAARDRVPASRGRQQLGVTLVDRDVGDRVRAVVRGDPRFLGPSALPIIFYSHPTPTYVYYHQ